MEGTRNGRPIYPILPRKKCPLLQVKIIKISFSLEKKKSLPITTSTCSQTRKSRNTLSWSPRIFTLKWYLNLKRLMLEIKKPLIK